jgi:hypothetical protein
MNGNPYSSAHSPTDTVRAASDVLLCLDSADRGVSTTIAGEVLVVPSTQPFNDFKLQKPQALVQGGIKRLKLNEVRFPYTTPNIVEDLTSYVWIQLWGSPSGGSPVSEEIFDLFASSPAPSGATAAFLNGSGFYNSSAVGERLVEILNADATFGGTNNTWSYVSSASGGFSLTCTPIAPNPQQYFTMTSATYNNIGSAVFPPKSLLTVLGFDTVNSASQNQYTPTITKNTLWSPMSFTQYIDIISVNLTRFQTIADTNTRQNSRGNLICRLYITDENSVVPTSVPVWNTTTSAVEFYSTALPPGEQPFTIHRQFQEPKVFRWENEASINYIDIQLYDDCGNLLWIPTNDETSSPANFQITFKCSEE